MSELRRLPLGLWDKLPHDAQRVLSGTKQRFRNRRQRRQDIAEERWIRAHWQDLT